MINSANRTSSGFEVSDPTDREFRRLSLAELLYLREALQPILIYRAF
jgi:hypothetical protein